MRHISTLKLVTRCLQSGHTLQVEKIKRRAWGGTQRVTARPHPLTLGAAPERFACLTQHHDYFARHADEIAAVFIDVVGSARAREVALRTLGVPSDAHRVILADRETRQRWSHTRGAARSGDAGPALWPGYTDCGAACDSAHKKQLPSNEKGTI
jgi:hypothetical protein